MTHQRRADQRSIYLFLATIFFLGLFGAHAQNVTRPGKEQPSGAPNTLPDPTTSMDYIYIPTRGVDAVITSATVDNGTWTAPDATVGSAGSLLFAHARPSLFKNLSTIGPDEYIYIQTEYGMVTYTPVAVLRVDPSDVDVLSGWKNDTLLLMTCGGDDDEWRDIVVATPMRAKGAILLTNDYNVILASKARPGSQSEQMRSWSSQDDRGAIL